MRKHIYKSPCCLSLKKQYSGTPYIHGIIQHGGPGEKTVRITSIHYERTLETSVETR